MMSLKLALLAVIALALTVSAGVREGCEVETYSGTRVLAVGESAPAKGSCSQITCGGHGGISGKSCGSFGAPGCKIVVDASKPFPDCCPRAICPERH